MLHGNDVQMFSLQNVNENAIHHVFSMHGIGTQYTYGAHMRCAREKSFVTRIDLKPSFVH